MKMAYFCRFLAIFDDISAFLAVFLRFFLPRRSACKMRRAKGAQGLELSLCNKTGEE
ncbi:MAG: hypothetical protein AB7T27_08975 [Kiritimatiellia bacterium]